MQSSWGIHTHKEYMGSSFELDTVVIVSEMAACGFERKFFYWIPVIV